MIDYIYSTHHLLVIPVSPRLRILVYLFFDPHAGEMQPRFLCYPSPVALVVQEELSVDPQLKIPMFFFAYGVGSGCPPTPAADF